MKHTIELVDYWRGFRASDKPDELFEQILRTNIPCNRNEKRFYSGTTQLIFGKTYIILILNDIRFVKK
jgi:hypothetical protein